MNLLSHGRRNSFYSLLCAAIAAVLVVAAGRSLQNGDRFQPTIQPYVTAPFRLLAYLKPFKTAPQQEPAFAGRSAFELSESESLLVVLYFALVGTVAAGAFAWLARRRGEPSHLWGFPAILSLLAGLQWMQLLYWYSARW